MPLARTRDVGMQAFHITLISTATVMDAERTGFRLETLKRAIVIVSTPRPEELEIATRRLPTVI